MDHAPVADRPGIDAADAPPAGEATCPFPHGGAPPPPPPAGSVGTCPIAHDATPATIAPGCPFPYRTGPVHRSKADRFVRRLLRIPERPAGVSHAAVYGAFQKSMLISATRCTLTYVIFPFVLPAVGFAAQGAVGVTVGAVAMIADVFTIRRFFAVDHKWRWYFSAIVLGIMILLTALLVQDISHLAGG